jgi:hypothetical protein
VGQWVSEEIRDQWVSEEIREEVKKFREFNKKENTT